jgi:hypothetical protein
MSNLTELQLQSVAIYRSRIAGLTWSFEDAGKHAELMRTVAAQYPDNALLPVMAEAARSVWLSHPDNPGWE